MLHEHETAGAEQRGGDPRDGERDGEPVLAAAVERDVGVVVAHLGVDGHGTDRDVGRVDRHDVDDARPVLEARQRRVALHEVDVETEAVAVGHRPGVRVGRQLEPAHLGARTLRP